MGGGDSLEKKLAREQPKSWFRKYLIEDTRITNPRSIRRVCTVGAISLIVTEALMVFYAGPPREFIDYYTHGLVMFCTTGFLYGAYQSYQMKNI
ncbi:MAG TPA: hypothetical protein HA224_04050 [Nanoarchaeota archaeon]|nr:hypothetical protein [Nanoarchaeota archaeon]